MRSVLVLAILASVVASVTLNLPPTYTSDVSYKVSGTKGGKVSFSGSEVGTTDRFFNKGKMSITSPWNKSFKAEIWSLYDKRTQYRNLDVFGSKCEPESFRGYKLSNLRSYVSQTGRSCLTNGIEWSNANRNITLCTTTDGKTPLSLFTKDGKVENTKTYTNFVPKLTPPTVPNVPKSCL